MEPLVVTHLFPTFRGLGGVEAVLQHHYGHDAPWGIDSRFAIYFEPEMPAVPRVDFLGLDAHSTLQEARSRLQRVRQPRPGLTVYHGMWGVNHWAEVDYSTRRIFLFHGETPAM